VRTDDSYEHRGPLTGGSGPKGGPLMGSMSSVRGESLQELWQMVDAGESVISGGTNQGTMFYYKSSPTLAVIIDL